MHIVSPTSSRQPLPKQPTRPPHTRPLDSVSSSLQPANEAFEQSEAESNKLREDSVEGLSHEQIITLLGAAFAATQQEQLQTLRAQLAATTQEQRQTEQQLETARVQAREQASAERDLSIA